MSAPLTHNPFNLLNKYHRIHKKVFFLRRREIFTINGIIWWIEKWHSFFFFVLIRTPTEIRVTIPCIFACKIFFFFEKNMCQVRMNWSHSYAENHEILIFRLFNVHFALVLAQSLFQFVAVMWIFNKMIFEISVEMSV